jgi:hypothetical protein
LPQLLLRSAWCYSAVFGLLRGKYKNVAENVATSCYSMLSNDTAETKKPAVLAGFALSWCSYGNVNWRGCTPNGNTTNTRKPFVYKALRVLSFLACRKTCRKIQFHGIQSAKEPTRHRSKPPFSVVAENEFGTAHNGGESVRCVFCQLR